MTTIAPEQLHYANSPAPSRRLFTAADLAAMPEHLPSGPVDFELVEGRFVPMSPTGSRHGRLQVQLGVELYRQGDEQGHGETYSETGVVISRNPDTVYGPDLSFVSKRSFPIRESREGYLETIPALIIEVRSKNDTWAELERKVADYLRVGAVMVWVFDPLAKTVREYRANEAAKILSSKDILTCDDIIPSFRLSLAELFGE